MKNLWASPLYPVYLVVDTLGFGAAVAVAFILSIVGWFVARRFPRSMLVVGLCLLVVPVFRWLGWDLIACRGSECNDLGVFILELVLALWVVVPGLVILVTSVYFRRAARMSVAGSERGS
jgi:hypothetical protein